MNEKIHAAWREYSPLAPFSSRSAKMGRFPQVKGEYPHRRPKTAQIHLRRARSAVRTPPNEFLSFTRQSCPSRCPCRKGFQGRRRSIESRMDPCMIRNIFLRMRGIHLWSHEYIHRQMNTFRLKDRGKSKEYLRYRVYPQEKRFSSGHTRGSETDLLSN